MDTELRKKYELSPEKLRYTCDPKEFKPIDKKDLGLEAVIIGQEIAIESIKRGLELEDKHSNIFVTGQPGMGRNEIISTVIKQYIGSLSPEQYKNKRRQRRDLLAAYNFKKPENPLIIELPQGRGQHFQKDLEEAVNEILKKGISAYEKEFELSIMSLQGQADVLSQKSKDMKTKHSEDAKSLKEELRKLNDKLATIDLESKEAEECMKQEEKITKELYELEMKQLEQQLKLKQKVTTVQSDNVSSRQNAHENYKNKYVKPALDKLKQKSPMTGKMKEYLEKLEEAIMHDVKMEVEVAHMKVGSKLGMIGGMGMQMPPPPDLSPYKVKILNELKPGEKIKGVPVIFEEEPTFDKLFGTIEMPKATVTGMEIAKKDQHLRLEAGSLIRANGGYLILKAMESLQDYALIKLIKDLSLGKANIRNLAYKHVLNTASEDTDLKVKTIVVGTDSLYQSLQDANERDVIDFDKTVNIKSELSSVVDNSPRNREKYSEYITKMCNKKGFKNVTPEGRSEIINYSSRLAGTKGKLTTRLSKIEHLLKEANLEANDSKEITSEHVKKAIEAKQGRHSLIKSKVEEFVTDGTKIIDTEKEIVGDVNALVVYTLEDSRFGGPAKLTATTSVGNQGVISLDVEAGSSGEIFKKAVFTLRKNLERLFAQDKTISLNGGISLEQSYSGVEGDSATLASFLAIISELSRCPVDQQIAVTGSMNQKGLVQTIGGANEKVEGFYQICKAKGLTGDQGVIIPKLNENDLMLNDEIVDSVKAGKFHIYSVSKPEEAIEIIMGNKACEYDTNGNKVFTEGTVYEKVDKKIISYNNAVKTKSD